jgi:hypothetical protein
MVQDRPSAHSNLEGIKAAIPVMANSGKSGIIRSVSSGG